MFNFLELHNFFLLHIVTTAVISMNSFLVYIIHLSVVRHRMILIACWMPKGSWNWLAEEIFKGNCKYQCRCTWWFLQLLLIFCKRTGVRVSRRGDGREMGVKTKPFMLCQREWALLKKLKCLRPHGSKVPLFLQKKPKVDMAEEVHPSPLSLSPISPAEISQRQLSQCCQRNDCWILER